MDVEEPGMCKAIPQTSYVAPADAEILGADIVQIPCSLDKQKIHMILQYRLVGKIGESQQGLAGVGIGALVGGPTSHPDDPEFKDPSATVRFDPATDSCGNFRVDFIYQCPPLKQNILGGTVQVFSGAVSRTFNIEIEKPEEEEESSSSSGG